jgi:hypothetical protein
MPIRINLLAEAQAAEEIRRRDPVKRAIVMAAVVISAVLVWSASLQVKLMSENANSSRLEHSLGSRTNEYTQILSNERKLVDARNKLEMLHLLATDRFLQSDLLNALQHATLEGIQITRLRLDQNYTATPEVKSKMVNDKFVPGKPGVSTEKITLSIEAKDTSPNPGGEAMNQFKEVIARDPFFQSAHVTTNSILLRELSTPQVDTESGRSFVAFKFECRLPDRER